MQGCKTQELTMNYYLPKNGNDVTSANKLYHNWGGY